MTNGRGGRRPGAGAPKGNRNALRHGAHSGDATRRGYLRRARQLLPPDDFARLIADLKAAPSADTDTPTQPPNVLHLVPPILPSTTAAAPGQSNPPSGLGGLDFRATQHGFFGATPFLRRHFPEAAHFEAVLDHLDRLATEEPEEYDRIRNKGAFTRAMFHELSAATDPNEALLYCRFCDWGQFRLRKVSEE